MGLSHAADAEGPCGLAGGSEAREELTTEPARQARYRREYLGCGVFALIER
ncbi:hypothetical protein [Streptomyces sp. NPDC017520]|uniref:hypothetical protein n=1 Tax=Streptomyces sp. NPDC017520 TaxID=3364998 RepID=UPI00379B7EAE